MPKVVQSQGWAHLNIHELSKDTVVTDHITYMMHVFEREIYDVPMKFVNKLIHGGPSLSSEICRGHKNAKFHDSKSIGSTFIGLNP